MKSKNRIEDMVGALEDDLWIALMSNITLKGRDKIRDCFCSKMKKNLDILEKIREKMELYVGSGCI